MATTKITNPDLFDITANTALRLPSGSTEQRPTSPSTGEWRYNTTTNLVEFYDGADWRELQSEDIPPIPSQNFNCVLYTGNGSTQSITGVGFKPDMVWIKDIDRSREHILCDTTRGSEKELSPNTNDAEENRGVYSFDTDGFTFNDGNTNYNENSQSYVAWCWKANGGTTSTNTDGSDNSTVQVNTKAGISIVQYTATTATSSSTAGHGLGTTPAMIILKRTDSSEDWYIWHKDLGAGGSALNQYLKFTTASQATATNLYGIVNSTVFATAYTGGVPNTNIAYCFAEKAEYSKFGSYTGNGSSNGPIVNTGFEPAYIMIKNSTAIYEWTIYDNKRSTSNPRNNVLYPNTSGAQNSGETGSIDFLSNGFQLRSSDGSINQNGGIIIYAAFASDPSTAPVLADSFNISLWTGNGSSQSISGLGFSPNWVWGKERSSTSSNELLDTIRGATKYIMSNSTAAQSTSSQGLQSFDSNGFSVGNDGAWNQSSETYVGWSWKANTIPTINTDGTIQSLVSSNQAAGFSIVKYTGNGSAGATIGHGLGAAPQMVLNKRLDQAASWNVFHTSLSTNHIIKLESSNAAFDASAGTNGGGFTVDATKLTIVGGASTQNNNNANGGEYIAYCFTSISGYSSIGSYTGVSSGVTITTGFRPSFMLIKSTSNVENWAILDTDRGSGKALNPNLSNAESDSALNTFTVTDTGFSFPDQSIADAMLNENGYEYLYWAIKENATPQPLAGFMSFLVIAGGGAGGGESNSGGGGAGGLRTSYGGASGGGSTEESNITLASGTYTITVGAGGGGGGYTGGNGSVSSIAASGLTTIESTGGGGGVGQFMNPPGVAGGSGGGGGYNNQSGGAGTANQGFAGGSGTNSGDKPGGGGGGASEAGNTDGDGHGGDGLSVEITGSAVFYAGGGSGGVSSSGTQRPGSDGGGGAGAEGNNQAPVAGTAYLGAGGGGGAASTTGANGGAGVVVLRILTSEYSGTTTGSPTVTTDGTHTILKYTGSGTYVHS